jgi:hypothetical protein
MSFQSRILHKRPQLTNSGTRYKGRPNPHSSPPHNFIQQLICTKRGEKELTFDWKKYAPEWKITYYNIEISNDKTEWFPIPPTTPYIEGHVVNLEPDTKYYFRIRAHNHKGYSSWSAIVSAKTEPLPPIPSKPTNFTVDESFIDPNKVKLQWNVSPKEEKIQSYILNYNMVGGETLHAITDTISTLKKQVNYFILSDLAANTMYNITIRGKNMVSDGELAQIEYKTIKGPKGPPKARLAPCVDSCYNSHDKINLMWTDNDNEDIYKYCIYVNSENSWQKIADVPSASNKYMVKDLIENSTYTFKIRACNKGIENNRWVIQEGELSACSKPMKTLRKPSDESKYIIVPKKATDGSIGYFKSTNIGQLTDESSLEFLPKHFIRKIYTFSNNKLYFEFLTEGDEYIKGAFTQLLLVEPNGNHHTLSKTRRNKEGGFYWNTDVEFVENKSYCLYILNTLPVNCKNIHFMNEDIFKGDGGVWDDGPYKGQPVVNSYARIKIFVRSKKQDKNEETFVGHVLRYGKWSKNTNTTYEIYNSLAEVRKIHGNEVNYNNDVEFEIRENDTGLSVYYLDNREIVSVSAKLYMTNSFFSRPADMERMLIKELPGETPEPPNV